MPSVAFNIENPEMVLHDLEQASQRLRREPTVPPSIIGLLSDLCDEIGEMSPGDLQSVAPTDWIAVQSAALRTLSAIRHDEDERQQRRDLRLLTEELRFRMARIADAQSFSEERPAKDVVQWLDSVWSVPQAAKGAVFDVSDRTWQRWAATNESGHPTGDADRHVRLVARVVGDLRYLLTANGVLAWLQTSEPDLGDRTPLEVIQAGDADGLSQLFALVARARSGAAA
ncbi:MAG: hypothetical protein ACXVFK_04785 [Solirubrobacteraceae bacterium]